MNNAARIAKLEALLTRVVRHRAELASQRAALPRPPTLLSAATATVPASTASAATSPALPTAPAPAKPVVSATVPAPSAKAHVPVPAPKTPSKEPEAAEMEFDLPSPAASTATTGSMIAKPVAAIPLETEGDSVVPFDSTPLASIVPQGTSASDGLELEIEPEDEAPSEMFPEPAPPPVTRPSTPPRLPSTRPAAMPSPTASAQGALVPEAIKSPGLPSSPAAVTVHASAPSAGPQSFRALLNRSLALRLKQH